MQKTNRRKITIILATLFTALMLTFIVGVLPETQIRAKETGTVTVIAPSNKTEYMYPNDTSLTLLYDLDENFQKENDISTTVYFSTMNVLQDDGIEANMLYFKIIGSGKVTVTVQCESENYIGEDSIEITVTENPYSIEFCGKTQNYTNAENDIRDKYIFADNEFLYTEANRFVPLFKIVDQAGIQYTPGNDFNIYDKDGGSITDPLSCGTYTLSCTYSKDGTDYPVKGEFSIISVNTSTSQLALTLTEEPDPVMGFYIREGNDPVNPDFTATYNGNAVNEEDVYTKCYENNGTGFLCARYKTGDYAYDVCSVGYSYKENVAVTLTLPTNMPTYGDSYSVSATVPESQSGGNFTYTSKDEDILAPGINGVYDTGRVGTTDITVIYESGSYYGTASASVTVKPKKIIVGYLEVKTKCYDGTADAVVNYTNAVITGLKSGDEVIPSYAGKFEDAEVGVDKKVTISVTLSGKDADNYVIDEDYSDLNKTETISPAEIVVNGLVAKNKYYDGKTDAEIDYSKAKISGIVGNENVTLSYSGEFINKVAELQKFVYVTVTLSGKDKDHYFIEDSKSDLYLTADINKALITVTGLVAKDKEYDEVCLAEIDETKKQVTGIAEGDDIQLYFSGEFDTKDIGENKKVNVTVSKLGDDNNNYEIDYEKSDLTLYADIKPKSVLKIAGTEVGEGESASGKGWSYTEVQDKAVLTLEGFTYTGGEPGIEYLGKKPLELIFKGTNTIAIDNGIAQDSRAIRILYTDIILNGDAGALLSLTVNRGYAIQCSDGLLEIKGKGRINAVSDDIGINPQSFLMSGGTCSVYGEYGIFAGSVKVTGGMLIASGRKYCGIYAYEKGDSVILEGGSITASSSGDESGIFAEFGNICIGKSAQLLAYAGTDDAAKTDCVAIRGNVINSIRGTGWANHLGYGTDMSIAATTAGQVFSYKRIMFPEKTIEYYSGGSTEGDTTDPNGTTPDDGEGGNEKPDDDTDTSKPGDDKDKDKVSDDEPVTVKSQTETIDEADNGTKTTIVSTTYTDGSKVTEKTVEKPNGSSVKKTTTTAADGTETVEKIEENADGSKKSTTTVTEPDGTQTTNTVSENVNGTVVNTQTVRNPDGSSVTDKVEKTAKDRVTTTHTEKKTDGSSTTDKVEKTDKGKITTTHTVKKADGSIATEKTIEKPDGSITVTTYEKDADDNVISSSTVVGKIKEDGTQVITAVSENADGSSSNSKTTIYTDGSSKTSSTTQNADGTITEEKLKEQSDGSATRTSTTTDEEGNVLTTENETVTVNKSGTVNDTTTIMYWDGSSSEKTVKTKADGSSTSTLTATDSDGNITVTVESSKTDGSSIEKSYAVDGDEITLTSVAATTSSASIPASVSVNGKHVPVTCVGEGAMKDNVSVTKVTLADSITNIGEDAFSGAKNLKTIKLSANVTEIAPGAFDGIKSNATFYISAETDEEFDALVQLLQKSGVSSKAKFKRS